MLETVSSKNSLIKFDQNRNRSGIYVNGGEDITLILKDNFANVFSTIADHISSNNCVSITKLWLKVCDDECKAVISKIKSVCERNNLDVSTDQVKLVVNKFRGNLGEIFAEMFFKHNFASDICEGSSYVPVDPNNERYVDATVTSIATRLPMGIQVKNYSHTDNETIGKIFTKAAAEDTFRIRKDKMIKMDDLAVYFSSPHQVLFSFTTINDLFKDEYKDSVIFLGPAYIDSKKLQGDYKTGIPAKPKLFKDIAEEILKIY